MSTQKTHYGNCSKCYEQIGVSEDELKENGYMGPYKYRKVNMECPHCKEKISLLVYVGVPKKKEHLPDWIESKKLKS